jgi:hypothetical protein
MDKKKFKILAIVDAVLIVALFVVMFTLKGQYNEQAQTSVKEQVGAYQTTANGMLQEVWKSVDQNGMAWKLVYVTLTGDKTEASFDAAVKAIEGDKDARFKQLSYMYEAAGIPPQAQNSIYEKAGLADKFLLKNEGGVKEVACGKNCVISFTFAKGKLKSSDYSALANYNMAEHFKLEAPAAYHFE